MSTTTAKQTYDSNDNNDLFCQRIIQQDFNSLTLAINDDSRASLGDKKITVNSNNYINTHETA